MAADERETAPKRGVPDSEKSTNGGYFLPTPELDRLIKLLRSDGFTVIGPRVQDAAIIYDEITSSSDLPRGVSDLQKPGCYRVHEAGHNHYFDFNVGPHSLKQYFFPPRVTIGTADKTSSGWQFSTPAAESPKLAFLGVRACELAAVAVQDRVFMQGAYVDPVYQARRQSALLIAVNCTQAAPTCFCTSMGTGPECRSGFDLALTEIDEGFVMEAGSDRGRELLAALKTELATSMQQNRARVRRQRAADQITKQLDTRGIRDLLLGNLEHPHWDDVAQRCLSCTNCTMVCPTCFCSTVEEVSDLTGEHVERRRQWDSCFNIDFSYTAGGTVRDDRRSRFRQWLTHKLASWHDQFDTSGCVGCGRCISWCPVGIDLTQEVAAIRENPMDKRQLPVIAAPVSPVCIIEKDTSQ